MATQRGVRDVDTYDMGPDGEPFGVCPSWG